MLPTYALDALTRRGCKCTLSNNDVPFIRDLCGKYEIDVVLAGAR